MDYVALKTEITTDPTARGYAAPYAAGSDIEVANLLNEIQAGIEVDVPFLDAWELQGAIVATEFAALDADRRALWSNILVAGRIEVQNTNVRNQILLIWVAGTTTRSNIAALQTRNGSRAEQLFGFGTTVTHSQVSQTRLI